MRKPSRVPEQSRESCLQLPLLLFSVSLATNPGRSISWQPLPMLPSLPLLEGGWSPLSGPGWCARFPTQTRPCTCKPAVANKHARLFLQASSLSKARDPSPMENCDRSVQSGCPPSKLGRNLASPQQAAFRFFETYRGLAPVFLDSLPKLLHVSEQQGTGKITISIWLLRPLSLICTGFEI